MIGAISNYMIYLSILYIPLLLSLQLLLNNTTMFIFPLSSLISYNSVNDAFEYTITRPLANVKHKPSGRYLFFQQDKATHPIFATMFPHNFEKDDGNPDNLIIKENLNQSHLVNDLIKQNQQHVQHVERDQASSAQVEDHSEQQQPQQTPSDQTASTTKVTWKDIQKQNTSNQ